MIFELLAVVFGGLAAGGLASILRRVVRAVPSWIIPVAAGAAMLLVAVSLEYSWYGRTSAALPDGVVVARANENRAPWRPWTYVRPYVDRFIAVDQGSIVTHADAPGTRVVDLYFFARWLPPGQARAAFDCEAGRRADLGAGASLGEGGAVLGAEWRETGLDDPVTRLACSA